MSKPGPLDKAGQKQLFDAMESWPEEDKARALDLFNRAQRGEVQVWYCKRGRTCDGKPHDGYNYSHARADQWPPAGLDWLVWALLGGRGSGKTRSGAEYIRKMSTKYRRFGLIGPTAGDVRDTMVTGVSGLIAVFALAGETITYQSSNRRVIFPSGAIAGLFSGEEPDRLRGPQHEVMWLDEPAHYPDTQEVWDQAMFGLRLGPRPHVLVTTTPLPTKWVKDLVKDEDTRAIAASTYANLDNLAPAFKKRVLDKYEGTRLGRQELYGEILGDIEGALWNTEMFQYVERRPHYDRIVVAIDPAGTANRRSDATGIIVVGAANGEWDVLDDRTGKYSPDGWATAALQAALTWEADAIVAEKNYGGDMVKRNIDSTQREKNFPPVRVIVKRASTSKQLRAEPVVARYEQKRVFHLKGLDELEQEQIEWVPGKGDSPNRIDALVWGIDELDSGPRDFHASSPANRTPPRPPGPNSGRASRFALPSTFRRGRGVSTLRSPR